MNTRIILVIVFNVVFWNLLPAQTPVETIDTIPASEIVLEEINNPPPSANVSDYTGPSTVQRSPFEERMSIIVLVFAFLVLLLEFFLILYGKLNTTQGIRIFAVTIIITSGLFLVAAGYNSQQIAPMVGLLGTIAGYLLGNMNPWANND